MIQLKAEDFFKEFQKRIEADPQRYYQDYLKVKERVNNSSAIYKGKPVDFLYQPFFLMEKDIKRLEDLTGTLSGILKKVIREYRCNPDFRSYFPFPSLMEKLILQDPGYKNEFPMARFDFFYTFRGEGKFCELNADGSSAMNEARVFQKVIRNSEALTGLEVRDFELFYSWLEALIENYKEFNDGIDDKPNIAIVDFKGEGTVYEFKEFQQRFNERGYKTIICDPGELEYRDGKLYYHDLEIKLVYRRATTIRMTEKADKIEDFIRAYQEGAVCVVGGFVSQIIHNKIIFAILHDEGKVPFLSREERLFIKKHIPYTAVFSYSDQKMVSELVNRKDKYVLKPFDKAASHGVYIGRDYTDKEWQELIDEIKGDNYLMQEFIQIPQLKMATVDRGEIYFEDYGYLIGIFMYNQVLSGLYTRVSRENIIGAIVECFTVPDFVVTEDGDWFAGEC